MANFVLVEVLDSSKYLMEKSTCFLIRQPLFLDYVIEKFTARSVFHNEEKLATCFYDFEKLDNVGMAHNFYDLNLAHDSGDVRLFFYFVFLKYFYRHFFLS